jgi:hypothetical protein
MKVQEVSLVDVAANLRKWVLLKRAEMTTEKADDKKPEQKDDAAPGVRKQDEIALPSQVKANLTGTLADALEKLGALAEMVGAATIDDAAPVPPMVAELLTQCAALLSGAADQLAAPPPEAAPPQVPEGGPPPPAPGEPMEASAKEADDVAKADELGVEAEKTLEKAKGLIAKAGRKMAGRRLKTLTKIVDDLVKLIRDLGDTDGVAKAGDKADPVAQFKEALDGLNARLDKMEGTIKIELAAVKKSVGEDAAKAAAIEKAAAERIDGISQALKTPAPSNLGEPGSKPVAKRTSLGDASDMAAEVRKRHQR